MSDFKSNEYANLIGGELYEPHEENPMIGYRGASRYLSPDFADCFAMECEALSYVRDQMGLTNVKIMIPFVRTLAEAEGVIRLLGKHGLKRGVNDLQVIMMCELPSNAVIADAFLDHFDGFSIGSNDMTQLASVWTATQRWSPAASTNATSRQVHAQRRHPSLQSRGKPCRHLRPRPQRPSRPRRMVARTGHRVHVAESRHCCRHLAPPRPAGQQSALTDAAIQHEADIKSQMPPAAREITLRFLAAPTDAGYSGNVGGGRVLEWIDKAGYACAVGWAGTYSVTAYVGGVRFSRPVKVGDLVEATAKLIHTGRAACTSW